jgi:outer membrane protein assembly factor BamB
MSEMPVVRIRKRSLVSRGLLALIFLVLCGGLTWVWVFTSVQRQDKFIHTALVLFIAFILFLLWVLFASAWRAGLRWSVFVGTVAVVLFCRFTLRISGVTGDLIPIVEWKWKKPRVVGVETNSASTPRSAANEAVPLTNSYPQFLGPNRDGTLPGPQLARDWKKNPPKELWRHPVGAAWSGFAVVGNFAITQEQRGEEELVVCYDLLTGKSVWSHADRSRYATTIAGEGPRATPTISSNRVYTIGGAGILNCLELATGTVVWTKDTIREHKATLPMWGAACSPLVTERAVIVTVGGAGHTLVAYDKATGIKLWASGNDSVHWSSPERVALAGVPQILIFHENVASLRRADWQTALATSLAQFTAARHCAAGSLGRSGARLARLRRWQRIASDHAREQPVARDADLEIHSNEIQVRELHSPWTVTSTAWMTAHWRASISRLVI